MAVQIQRMAISSNTLILAKSKYGSNYANRSMPQKMAGWLVRYFLSKLLIWSTSSLVSSKSKTWKFSSNLPSLAVFGMTTVSRWMPHRRTICATVLLYFAANRWHREKQVNKTFARPQLEKFGSNLLMLFRCCFLFEKSVLMWHKYECNFEYFVFWVV